MDSQSERLEPTCVRSRFNSLIPQTIWKLWLILAAGLLVWAGLLWVGASIERQRSGVVDVLGLRAGHVSRFFATVHLLAATQFSLLILWYRVHSRKDFNARYRVWIWSAATWAVFTAGAATGQYIDWGARLLALRDGADPRLAPHAWIVPAGILFLTTTRLLAFDMHKCRESAWLLRSALAAAVLSLGVSAGGGGQESPLWLLVIRAGACTLWPLLLAGALLRHASFVIHVTNEAVPLRARRSRLNALLLEGLREARAMAPRPTGRLLRGLAARGRTQLVRVAPWLKSLLTALAYRRKPRRTKRPRRQFKDLLAAVLQATFLRRRQDVDASADQPPRQAPARAKKTSSASAVETGAADSGRSAPEARNTLSSQAPADAPHVSRAPAHQSASTPSSAFRPPISKPPAASPSAPPDARTDKRVAVAAPARAVSVPQPSHPTSPPVRPPLATTPRPEQLSKKERRRLAQEARNERR